uniref:protein phosphatase 1 regulatory subunit 3E n=1 Tax=Pristiophorus japonicus TaxID=55135 RepID=UPI00398E95BB
MEETAVHSSLCIPRNFSCMAALYGSLADDCSLAEEAGGAAEGGGGGGLEIQGSEGSQPKNPPSERQRSRNATTSTNSSSNSPSPGQRRRAKSLPAPGHRDTSALERVAACPARRKNVRFADSLGLELTTIRHFCDADMPQIPHRVMARLREERPERLVSRDMLDMFLGHPAHALEPQFVNPGSRPDFLEQVRLARVCLEGISTDQFSILGTVRVSNLAYEKQVVVRYTLNQWTSSVDIAASYTAQAPDGQTDFFSFKLVTPVFLDVGGTLQFAIRYTVAGQEYWDNNGGSNYQLLLLACEGGLQISVNLTFVLGSICAVKM